MTLILALKALFLSCTIMADHLKGTSKEQIQCTMCSACENPCNQIPSPPPPASTTTCPPPPSHSSSGGTGTYYYSPPPPPPSSSYDYSSPPPPAPTGAYYPPPNYGNYPTPPPPNPIVPYFPFYFYSPPLPSTAWRRSSSVKAFSLISSLVLLV
ncbi:leucine-rich repeat extensin-like protein 6 [Senna tora]|uniref:Leucine-rich repeat extensin-like protein 6 n=1 Tax=Senna tora TaxID=362788 RepID=A0A834X4Z0_9FABA|nr:leucine-rich repeat extensin-like protein 6 [Senna tora]